MVGEFVYGGCWYWWALTQQKAYRHFCNLNVKIVLSEWDY